MKCPFKTPAKYEMKITTREYIVIDVERKVIAKCNYEDDALFIQQVINSHEKLEETINEIEAVSCGERQIESDGVYDDSDGMLWIYKRIQALKEAEKE